MTTTTTQDRRVKMVKELDGTFTVTELNEDAVASLIAEQAEDNEFIKAHNMPRVQFLALLKRQSERCGDCSREIDQSNSYYESGADKGSAIFCVDCSPTLTIAASEAELLTRTTTSYRPLEEV